MPSFNFSVVLFRGLLRPLGDVWGALGGSLGRFGGFLGGVSFKKLLKNSEGFLFANKN